MLQHMHQLQTLQHLRRCTATSYFHIARTPHVSDSTCLLQLAALGCPNEEKNSGQLCMLT